MSTDTQLEQLGNRDGGPIQPAANGAVGAAPEATAYQTMAAPEEDVLRYYWRVLYGRRWLILATTLLGLSISAVYTLRQPRLYQAQATVEFIEALPPGKDLDMMRDRTTEIPPALAQRLLTTKVLAAYVIRGEEQKGRPLFQDKAPSNEEPSLWQTVSAWLGSLKSDAVARARIVLGSDSEESESQKGENNEPLAEDLLGVAPPLIDRYYGHISINPVRDTSVADIVVTDENPATAARIANTHAQAFINMDVETKISSLSDAQSIVRQQLQEARANLENSRRALSTYQQENGILSLPKDNTTVARESLQQLNGLLTAAQADRIKAEAEFRNAKAMAPDALATTLPDPNLRTLREELLATRAKYEQHLKQFGPSHHEMAALRARITSIESQLNAAGQQALKELQAAFAMAVEKERDLRNNFEKAGVTAGQEDRKLIQLLILERDVESNQTLYSSLLDQAKEADLSTGGFRWSNVKLIDRAAVPRAPAYPRTSRNLGLGLFLGCLVGVLGILFVDRMDTRIHTPDEAEMVLQLPSFGVVPDFDHLSDHATYGAGYGHGSSNGQEASDVMRELAAWRHPASVVSEAYRGVCMNILFSSPGSPPKVILVTSAQSAEGKTVTVVNLAISLRLLGNRVLIIDADLRRPGCHKLLKVDRKPGLSDVLTGHSELVEATVRVPLLSGSNGNGTSEIQFMPAGTRAPNPAQLLASSVMTGLLGQLKEQFDFVLIDSPPVLPVTDSVMLSTKADGVLMVVRGGEWGREVSLQALSHLDKVRARMLGVVLNRVDIKRGGRSGYYYRYYHSYSHYYGADAEEDAEEQRTEA
jgi:polysaccharide biosynthesis transport protein